MTIRARNTLSRYVTGEAARRRSRADESIGTQYTCLSDDVAVCWAVPNNVVIGYADVPDYNNEVNGSDPTVRIAGSINGFVAAYNRSTVSVEGGIIESSLYAYHRSVIHVRDGCIAYNLVACNHSVIEFVSGSVGGDLQALGGVINFRGGCIGNGLQALGSMINFRGGSVGGSLQALGSGAIHIYGRNLSSRLVAPDLNGFSQHVLAGALEDGTDITGKVITLQNGSGARFTLNKTPAASGLGIWHPL